MYDPQFATPEDKFWLYFETSGFSHSMVRLDESMLGVRGIYGSSTLSGSLWGSALRSRQEMREHQGSPRDSTETCNQNKNVAYNDRIARHTY